MSSMQPIQQKASLTEQVSTMIRAAIVAGEMAPGEHYSAIGISEKLGVSRTPVREALQLLEKEGIVTVAKNRGVRVNQISLDEIVEVFQLRLAIEPAAASRGVRNATEDDIKQLKSLHQRMLEIGETGDGRATLEADKEFHLYLLGLAGNAKLDNVVGELRNLVLAHGQTTVPFARSSQDLAGDREEIMAAILAKDPDAAATAVRDHVKRTAQMLIKSVCSRTEGLDAQPFLERLDALIS
ncbi:DNA-binding GntR family transcriptional regulator [Glutamicibacter mysorens]|uniref:DNA-binding GntR family transcriptional regulator n=1 Tax=Glutamicibacter mysorens TaxID=257984 RepID=A0ABX4MUH6_9MICC|nr:GntR family transcriptional regulator [Glutamicibacter mysorens]PJJ42895.1 DNA-binding GntR family transcriptional regulator [Glutamicibacter mysorens]